MWFCYILRNTQPQHKNATYNGSTNNPTRRLRQHNGEICGGARATTRKKGGWEFCAVLAGFPDHINCLSCEWRMKCPSGRPGRRETKYHSPRGRMQSLNEILPLTRWTGKCKIDNGEYKMKLYVVQDLADALLPDNIPDNIEVVYVDKIDPSLLDLDESVVA